MSNQLSDAIGRCLISKLGKDGTNCVKFRYTILHSLEDDIIKIDVRYKLGQVSQLPSKEESGFAAVVKDKTFHASNSNETSMYFVVLPEMNRILKAHNIIWKDHVTKFNTKTLYLEENFIFLECISSTGRINNGSLAFNNAKIVLRKLAQFHATSLVYLKKLPVDDVISETSPLLANDEVETRMNAAIKTIEAYWPEFKEIATKMRSCVETFRKRLTHLLDKNGQTLKVIALGEPYMKNMHFQYTGNDVEDVVFSNFSNCFVGSCGYDLNLFLNTCLNFDALTRERYKLLHCYYEHFSGTLKSLNENSIPSWQTILDDVHKFELIGFYGLLCEMPFCSEKNDLPKCYMLDEMKTEGVMPISLEQEYKFLFKSARVEDMLKYGLYRFNEIRVWDYKTNWEKKPQS
ncbi:uncharacterized protein LOC118757455, partial [Rhagoletis pomonella]|uniref:uncharacterized protein LOC118757455 n=1 Tax=Rhagoletis pomonella TaxID=28610 RepID=UPI0017817BB7